jgi:glycosyltransferase involved in cell wall biosynthesis
MGSAVDEIRRRLLSQYPHLGKVAAYLSSVVDNVIAKIDAASIVVTCKNKSSSLPAVIARIGMQTRRPDMVVLADDASTDNSVELFINDCRRFGLKWDVAALRSGENYRLNTVRNLGFQRCPDSIVMLMDADLVLSPVYVERHLAIHSSSARPLASVGPRFEYASDACDGPVNFMWGNGAEGQGIERDAYLPAWQRAHGALCVARSVWQAIGGFDEGYNGRYGIEDIDFVFRLFLAGIFARCDFEGYVIHIPHPTTFGNGGRNPDANIEFFCRKFSVPESILADSIDYSPLATRRENWANDFEAFSSKALARIMRQP